MRPLIIMLATSRVLAYILRRIAKNGSLNQGIDWGSDLTYSGPNASTHHYILTSVVS
jgi:hypothetical protein